MIHKNCCCPPDEKADEPDFSWDDWVYCNNCDCCIETPEEKAKREAIDDRLGKLAVALDESVRVLVEELV